ncbi:uncharacterized protein LOC142350918 [Convolutriloba macropyga]|uniref:uncharacterized protein LOC142350918 n=1 Tax=Convolutriloba macropyga TaxID=536237 RepID=UPI003F51D97F
MTAANGKENRSTSETKRLSQSGHRRQSNHSRKSHQTSVSSETSDNVFATKDTTAILNMDKVGKFQPRQNLSYRSSNFGLADLARDTPLRKIYSEGDNGQDSKLLDPQDDNLKLGREFYLYKQQLLRNPKDKRFPTREDSESINDNVLKAPGVLNGASPGYQYRPVSKKPEPDYYRVEEPKHSEYKVKAWIQDSKCECKKKGMQRYIQSVLQPTSNPLSTHDDHWKDTGSKSSEQKWRKIIQDWFRVYKVKCDHRVSSCTFDVEFTVSVDKLSQKKLKGYLQSFGKINHVLFDYSMEGIY